MNMSTQVFNRRQVWEILKLIELKLESNSNATFIVIVAITIVN